MMQSLFGPTKTFPNSTIVGLEGMVQSVMQKSSYVHVHQNPCPNEGQRHFYEANYLLQVNVI